MATQTRIDPLKQQRAARWTAFVNQYHPSANDIKDRESFFRWAKLYEQETKIPISEKFYDFKQDFEDLGGYGEIQKNGSNDGHAGQHPSGGGHGSAISNKPVAAQSVSVQSTPLQESDGLAAVAEAERLVAPKPRIPDALNANHAFLQKQRAVLSSSESVEPFSPEEQARRHNRSLMIKAMRKPPPGNGFRLPSNELQRDPRFAQIQSRLTTEYQAGKRNMFTTPLLPGSNVATELTNVAEGIFRRIHAKASREYDSREKKHIYESTATDPLYRQYQNQSDMNRRSAAREAIRFALQRNLPEPSFAEIEEIKKEEAMRQSLNFALQFPEKASAYAKKDPTLQETVSFLQDYKPSPTDEIHPSWETVGEEYEEPEEEHAQTVPQFTPRPVPLTVPFSSQQDGDSGEERRDISRSYTRDERQQQNNQQQTQQQPRSPQSFRDRLTRNQGGGNAGSGGSKTGRGLKKGGKAAGNATKKVAKKVAKQVAQKLLLASWEFWAVLALGILILLLILFLIYIISGAVTEEQNTQGIPAVVVSKSVDKTEIKNPSELTGDQKYLTYSLTTSFAGKATELKTTEDLPFGTRLVKASGNFTAYDEAGAVITDIQAQRDAIKQIVWSTSAPSTSQTPTGTEPTTPQASTSISVSTYTQAPYSLPAPAGNSDISFTQETITRLNTLGNVVATHQDYLISKVKNNNIKYVDPFVSVIWAGAIEGTGGNPYSWNCMDRRNKGEPDGINLGCKGGFTSGGWQVSYGMQVSQAITHLVADFNEVYGENTAANAQKVQEVGQSVIDNSSTNKEGKITNPASFPSQSIPSLISEAKSGNESSQQALAILLMSPAVGGISVAQEVAGNIAGKDNWRATMEGWGSYYSSNMQKFSNRMQALATSYTGTGGGQSSTAGRSFPAQNYSLVLEVLDSLKDTYIINQATAVAVGAMGTAGPSVITEAAVPAGGSELANVDTCNGAYTSFIAKNPLQKNFGDPSCTLDEVKERDGLYALLKQQDPTNADKWFFSVIPCESGYIPNAWADPIVKGTPDPVGAWGLFQMGQGRAGANDHGDVPWQQQVTNAVTYNNALIAKGIGFHYWACAKPFWQ